jgi:NAD(P)-dependent dehydrogenase (short-subunit alcohol dehydrogenase family)
MAASTVSGTTFAKGDAKPLAGEVALVTGSGRGIGRQIAERLRSLGATIILHDLNESAVARFGEAESLSALAKSLAAPNTPKVETVTGDVTDADAVEAMVEKAVKACGDISVLVNCAGGDIGADGNKPNPSTPTNFKLEDVYSVLDCNLIGTMLLCRAVAPLMAKNKRGSIINIASVHAHRGVAVEVGYSCAKAAVVHYTRCLAQELREHGVRVNAISPGPTKTARFLATRDADDALATETESLVRYGDPADIANAISFFAGPDSGFISGQVMLVDGGDGLYPT